MTSRRSVRAASALAALCLAAVAAGSASRGECAEDLLQELQHVPYQIVYESHPEDNWELMRINADGSQRVNLTRTPEVNEIYPHVSPDGARIAFLTDQGQGETTLRSAYLMDVDGAHRKLIGDKIRWTCWNADGSKIAYLKCEPGPFSFKDGTTKGLFFYDLATGSHTAHRNDDIYHIYNVCWSPSGKWLLATVSGGMGYEHANLALEADGQGVFDLGLRGCRPDISPDGRLVAWGCSDWSLRVGELDSSGPEPRVVNTRDVVTSEAPMMVYHVDWSPDGKYVAFSRGPRTKSLALAPPYLGAKAEGWDICVADAAQLNRWVRITTDGRWNKEPDWVPVARSSP